MIRPLNPSLSFVYLIYEKGTDAQFFESIYRNKPVEQLIKFLEENYDAEKYYWQIYSLVQVEIKK